MVLELRHYNVTLRTSQGRSCVVVTVCSVPCLIQALDSSQLCATNRDMRDNTSP